MAERISTDLLNIYNNYYSGDELSVKRSLAARDSVDHIQSIKRESLGKLIDVGAGNGSVINELLYRGSVDEVTALEISETGIEKIKGIKNPKINNIVKFDGYKIPFPDKEFDTAICIHVLEHVEHERILIREISRVSKEIFIEVPLEGGMRGRLYYGTGHINYYTPLTFRALLETSGLEVVSGRVVSSSRAYENHLYGRARGMVRHVIRKSLLSVLGRHAPNFMTYLYVAHCRPVH